MNEEKMNKFIDAVMKDATEQSQRILNEIEKEKAASLVRKEDEILNAIYHRIQAEINNIKHHSSRTISLETVEMRRELLKKRDEITSRVFKELEERLDSFVESKEYDAFLSKLLAGFVSEDVKILCKPSHIERVKNVAAALSLSAAIEPEPSVKIGGVIIQFNQRSQRINETLDARLSDQYEYFNLISGLTIS